MNAVAEAILSAKSEIYIKDWWLTPELVCVYYFYKKNKIEQRIYMITKLNGKKRINVCPFFLLVFATTTRKK